MIKMKNSGSLLILFLTIHALYSQTYLPDSLRVDSLIKQSTALRKVEKIAEAEQVAEVGRDLALQLFGEQHLVYANSCHNLGTVYLVDPAKQAGAEANLLLALRLRREQLGELHPDYGRTLNNLALYYGSAHRYEKAVEMYLIALSIKEKAGYKDSFEYSKPLNNLAMTYMNMGRFRDAENRYKECLENRARTRGLNSPEYAAAANGLANVYQYTGQFRSAEQYYTVALAAVEKSAKEPGSDYSRFLNNLAMFYLQIGRYEDAETCLKHSMEFINPNTRESAIGVNNLGLFYTTIGQFGKAESILLDALKRTEQGSGKNSEHYARVLDNLGSLYYMTTRYSESESYLRQALAIWETIDTQKRGEYSRIAGNLAICLYQMKRYAEAEALVNESVKIREGFANMDNFDYACLLNNRGDILSKMKRYPEAKLSFEEALAIKERLFGKVHQSYRQTLSDYSEMCAESGNWDEAIALCQEADNIQVRLLLQGANYLSDREMQNWIGLFETHFDKWQSFAWVYPDKRLSCTLYNDALFYKGFLLENTARFNKLAVEEQHSDFAVWKGICRKIGEESVKPYEQREDIKSLQTLADSLEKALLRSVPGFGETRRQTDWKEVQAALHAGEAAVEFLCFKQKFPEITDTVLYAALVLLPDGNPPRFIPLFEERSLLRLFAQSSDSTGLSVGKLYAASGNGAELFRLIWQPLEQHLKGIRKVFYAPAGQLHRIAFPVLFSSQYLGERYTLVQMGSTRQVLANEKPVFAQGENHSALVYGGIRYDAVDQRSAGNPQHGLRTNAGPPETWPFLEESGSEAKEVTELLRLAGFQGTLKLGDEATESAFKTLAGSSPAPALIYIPTHGYFFSKPDLPHPDMLPNKEQPVFTFSDDPLIRSGLLLAGANKAWSNRTPPGQKEDGILTAYEISQMRFDNTGLVVLSACDSGLGDIAGNEGVYGLQRAFKIAGARYLLVSLWKTPDKATRELMTIFLKYLLRDKDEIHVALQKARRDMQLKYPDPYYWGAFILAE